ncbi:tetratricopeptide repeat protein 19, mitochondrial isoform X10 [Macaca fascicularis]
MITAHCNFKLLIPSDPPTSASRRIRTTVEEKANTHLLLGMCLDACARYLLFSKQPSQAQRMYEKALQISEEIQGERHPQTIVLMSDLATTLDAQGRFDEAYIYMQRASDLARQINHPELHMVLSNLAAVLMHRETWDDRCITHTTIHEIFGSSKASRYTGKDCKESPSIQWSSSLSDGDEMRQHQPVTS